MSRNLGTILFVFTLHLIVIRGKPFIRSSNTLFTFYLCPVHLDPNLISSFSAYVIPLPFGNVSVEEGPDGKKVVGINHGINIGGYGTSSGLTINGNNGSGGSVQTHGGILANGSEYGTSSTFGGDKQKGVQLDTDLNLGNDTVHGGVGKETQFFDELGNVVNKKKEDKPHQ